MPRLLARDSVRRLLVMAALAGGLAGCGAKMPNDVGVGALAPCPGTPNCVSSVEVPSSPAYVEPMAEVGPPEVAWAAVLEELGSWPRLQILAVTDDAIHAEVKSLVFRFEDDLELRLQPLEARIDVRSASRLGRSDLGANRRRVETLRDALTRRGVVSPGPSTWQVAP